MTILTATIDTKPLQYYFAAVLILVAGKTVVSISSDGKNDAIRDPLGHL